MDRRQRQELDRHITGNYGADQERKHTASRDDGNGALEESSESATCSDCHPQWGARYKSPYPIILCPLHEATADLLTVLDDLVAKTEPLEMAYGTKEFVAKLDAARASSHRAGEVLKKARGQ